MGNHAQDFAYFCKDCGTLLQFSSDKNVDAHVAERESALHRNSGSCACASGAELRRPTEAELAAYEGRIS